MDGLHFADNLVLMRKERKVTQEQLAEFIGVTKASVSKWETGQSIPDVVILPKLAAFFDRSIDEILGYEPALSKEQIAKIYLDLCREFAEADFSQTMEKSRQLVRQYYACYPFLYQMVLLWVNHWMLAETVEVQQEILYEALDVCQRILEYCKDFTLCNDVVVTKAMIYLFLGRPQEVIEELEEIADRTRLATQSEGVLMEAYLMNGDLEKGKTFTQVCMYNHLFAMISCATGYLALNSENLELCKKTEKRINALIDAYELENLNPNTTGLFYYQLAIVYGTAGRREAAEQLLKYAHCIDKLLEKEELVLRTDEYFDRLETWFEKLELQGKAPREKKVVWESFRDSIKHPAFKAFTETEEYREIEKIVEKRGKAL